MNLSPVKLLFSSKRRLLLLIVVGIMLIGGFVGRQLWQPSPNELVTSGLERINGAVSFRYSVTQHQWVDGKDRILTQIQGEKAGGNTRIFGQLVGSEVEMILIGDALYNRDPFTKSWVRFSSAPAAQEVFLAELNPLSSLQFKELGEVVLSGQQKLDGEKVWVCNFKPSIQNQIMEEFWSDFTYTLFISKSQKTIVKAIIQATNKEKMEPMSMTLQFKDIGKKISILTPNI
ncbi:MAG: LolA-like protein [Desulfitobacteriaceae bacterium]